MPTQTLFLGPRPPPGRRFFDQTKGTTERPHRSIQAERLKASLLENELRPGAAAVPKTRAHSVTLSAAPSRLSVGAAGTCAQLPADPPR